MSTTTHDTRSLRRTTHTTASGVCARRRRSPSRGRLRPLSTIEWLALFVAALGVAVAIASTMMATDTPAVLRWEQHVVAEGATLWSIAESCALPGLSVAETVEIIRDHNVFDGGMLRPGQLVSVPTGMVGEGSLAAR